VGYVKAASLVWALYLLLAVRLKKKPFAVIAIAAMGMVVFGACSIYKRISIEMPDFANKTPQWASSQPTCMLHPNARVELESLKSAYLDSVLMQILAKKKDIATLRITNLSPIPLKPYQGIGTVNAGYQWFSRDGATIKKDGERVPIPKTLSMGEQATVSFPILFPQEKGKYLLRLTLVQEGCNWLYQLNPAIAVDMPFDVK